jgi:hypothetical protein
MSDKIAKVEVRFSDSARLDLASLVSEAVRAALEEQGLKQPRVPASALKAADAAAQIGIKHKHSKQPCLNIDGKPLEQWVTQQQLAAILPFSERYWERKRADGFGPPFSKVGKKVLYYLPHVWEWLARQSFISTAAAKRGMAREP